MIAIRKRTYTSENSYDDTFTRLGLDVENVEDLIDSFYTSATVDTNKRWVGIIEKEIGAFEIIKPNPTVIVPARFLDGNFFNLYVHGRVVREGVKCKIKLDFNLGLRAVGVFVVTCLFPLLAIVGMVAEGRWEEIQKGGFLLLVFITLGPSLLIFQLNSTEEKIRDTLGVR